jgi:lysophospholipase L1-like esterase
MRKYLILAAMGLAACGSDKKSSTTTPTGNGNSTVTDPNTTTGDGNTTIVDESQLTGPQIAMMGRFTPATGGGNLMAWAGSRITARIKGSTTASINLTTSNAFNQGKVKFSVTVDGEPANPAVIELANDWNTITPFTVTLPDTNGHVVQWTKISEPAYGLAVFKGVTAGTGGTLTNTPAPSERHIEFIGDSITNGYGVMGVDPCNGNSTNSNADESFATLTAKSLAADYTLIAYSGRGLATNLDGTTSTSHDAGNAANANDVMPAMFLDTIPPSATTPTPVAWSPNTVQPNVVVINLGTNDFSGATNAYIGAGNTSSTCTDALCNPNETTFVNAYAAFLSQVRATYPDAYIVATTGPMLSDSYPGAAQQHVAAKTYITSAVTTVNDAKISFYDFGVQDTAATACNSHPNAAEHQAMASGGTDAQGTVQPGLVSHIKLVTGWL